MDMLSWGYNSELGPRGAPRGGAGCGVKSAAEPGCILCLSPVDQPCNWLVLSTVTADGRWELSPLLKPTPSFTPREISENSKNKELGYYSPKGTSVTYNTFRSRYTQGTGNDLPTVRGTFPLLGRNPHIVAPKDLNCTHF